MHFKIIQIYRLIAINLALLTSLASSAALLSANDSTFGINSLTIDTSTNLAWLDLSITEGISFNNIASELGAGGTYSGYRFASPDEVFSLFTEAQIPDINAPGDFANYGTIENAAPALTLIELLGPSYQIQSGGVLLSQIAGFSSQQVAINGFDLIQMPYATVREGVITQDGTQSFGEVFTVGSSIFPSNPYEGVGSWLVKPAVVPLPSAAILLFSGLAFLTIISRKNKKLSI